MTPRLIGQPGVSSKIRFGPGNCFRVLYGIDEEKREVQIQAIGVKDGNRLLVADEEVEL